MASQVSPQTPLIGGGYDFPGSNSGVDLFSLTGWIPERIFFPKDPARVRDFETPPERAWERLCSASSFGDCLITMSTSSDLEEEMANEAGIVTGHAYAVLTRCANSKWHPSPAAQESLGVQSMERPILVS